jgi:lipid II:glycine glycyltransferase (peptidoglycan interpeptide bridge formation enzyme)
LEVEILKDGVEWNALIEALPGAHALQTWQWGQVKSHFGWQPHHLIWREGGHQIKAAALVLERKVAIKGLTMPISILYVPRGPIVDWSQEVLVGQVFQDLKNFAKAKKTIFIKIDPDLPVGFGIPGEESERKSPIGEKVRRILKGLGWVFSEEQIQFRNTVLVDIKQDEEDLLMRMKSKTRYNIRLAKRRGVLVRRGDVADIELLYKMYAHTAVRDDFLIRGQDYYKAVWETFFKANLATPLIAEVESQAVGAAVIFHFAKRAWYFHGMSLDEHREKMFNYLLQWEAMLYAKEAGCHTYDMWGAPDEFTQADPLWGVYRFKDGFGGQVVRTLGAWDYPNRPMLYRLYSRILPRILSWMRRRGKTATQRSLST